MERQYLIDSNVVIDYLSGKINNSGMLFLNEVINDLPYISVITKIEILGYKTPPGAYQLLTDFTNDCAIIGLNDEIVEKTIGIRKDVKIKLPDAIIAASAISFDLTLITRNTKDFNQIKELELINPYSISI
jgi:predicted nucleic acid-binding protein